MTPALLLSLAVSAPAAPADPTAAPDVRAAVKTGLDWLAKQQKGDGSWAGVDATGYQTTITATAGLAFLMEGSTPADGPYAPNIRKAVEWIEKTTKADGPLASSDPNEKFQYVHSHTAALLFLACAYDADTDPDRRARVKKLLDRAVKFLADCRSTRNGWGYARARDTGNYDDSHTTATVLHALGAARKAGIDVPRELTDGAVGYLVKCTGPDGGVMFNLPIDGTPVAAGNGQPFTAAATAAALGAHDGPRPDVFAAWVKHAGAAAAAVDIRHGGVHGMLIQCNVARLAFALGESGHAKLAPDVRAGQRLRWSAHRAKVFKTVSAVQQKDGSWADQTFGPAYATAVALLLLQLDNDYLPAFSR